MLKVIKKPVPGALLISEPFLNDSYFRRAVVLLTEHSETGTLGFILNRPTDLKISEALKDFPEFDAPLYFGGPVETDALFYIHTLGQQLEGSEEIAHGIYWNGDFEQLKLMIESGQVTKNEVRFFVGYSGWEPKQLISEIKEKAWLMSESTNKITFFARPKDLWRMVLRAMGNEYAVISNFPEDPQLN